ncbi:hypothetical protein [endosymbiont GvMRE of Glomus versiforme]|uniref:hypothetical protein n=1 Tax=endosymbiont GvMRE of Glomus versiforme TaxID=2039283 RepID=UPI0011C43CEE|nr:hypothetical protein [endosymbiont GvMRE of Glomus versiforme]
MASVNVPAGATMGTITGLGLFNVIGSVALAPATGGASLLLGAASAIAAASGTVATANLANKYSEINNNKGSTIKLINEMRESNNKLGEKDNRLSDRIKANI